MMVWTKLRGGIAGTLSLIASCASAFGDESSFTYSGILPRTDFGSVGLIEMPSAEMAPDATLSATLAYFRDNQRYNLGFQALPWLELSSRYAAISHFYPDGRTYYDRSYGFKARLFEEGEYLPAMAIGVRDIKATGIYASEYLTFSKHYFDDFDVTAGLGWGRMGTSATFGNPFGDIDSSFNKRSGLDGSYDLAQLFHGPNVGVFGGIVWQTPIQNLAFTAEYSSDRYVEEDARGIFKPRSQVNVGLSYQAFDFAQIGVDWLYGRAVAVNVSFALDPTTSVFSHHNAPPMPAPEIRSDAQRDAALQALLQGAKPIEESRRNRTGAIVDFADTVMTEGVRNIALHGTRLVIVADRKDVNARSCRAVADMAATLPGGMTAVDLSTEDKSGRISCAVLQPAAQLTQINYAQDVGVTDRFVAPVNFAGSPDVLAAAGAEPDTRSVEAKIRADGKRQRIRIEAVSIAPSEIVVYYSNTHYRKEADAVSRLARVLMADAPPNVEFFRLVALYQGIPFQEYRVVRAPLERLIAQGANITEAPGVITVQHPSPRSSLLDALGSEGYPRFTWAILPKVKQNYFSSADSTQASVSLGVSGRLALLPGLSVSGEFDGNLWNDFDAKAKNLSTLPHVRSDLPQYLDYGAEGIGQLYGAYNFGIAPGLIGVAKAGYLEDMFGGAGGELLWQPEHSRLSFGLDAYEVWQRDYDRLFGFRPYHTFTGHLAVYYRSPWYGLNFNVLGGRYLAGDYGATFEITRRFLSGVEIGAFATVTNVSSQQFGQGSFDKGILLRIPLEWALPVSSQSTFASELKPVLRDGGQRLQGDTSLYDETQRMSFGDSYANFGDPDSR